MMRMVAIALLLAAIACAASAQSIYREFLRVKSVIVDDRGGKHTALVAIRPIELVTDLESGDPAPIGELMNCEQQTRVRAASAGNPAMSQLLLECHQPERSYIVRGFIFAH